MWRAGHIVQLVHNMPTLAGTRALYSWTSGWAITVAFRSIRLSRVAQAQGARLASPFATCNESTVRLHVRDAHLTRNLPDIMHERRRLALDVEDAAARDSVELRVVRGRGSIAYRGGGSGGRDGRAACRAVERRRGATQRRWAVGSAVLRV